MTTPKQVREVALEIVAWMRAHPHSSASYQRDQVRVILECSGLFAYDLKKCLSENGSESSSATSVLSSDNFTEHLRKSLEDFVNNATDAEMEQAFKDADFEIYRHVKGDPTGFISRLGCGSNRGSVDGEHGDPATKLNVLTKHRSQRNALVLPQRVQTKCARSR